MEHMRQMLILILLVGCRIMCSQTIKGGALADVMMTSIMVPDPQFSEPTLRSMSLDLIRTSHLRLRSVWFFRSQTEAGTFFNSYPTIERPYDGWLRVYQNLKGLFPVAQLITIGDSAVLLIR